MNPQFQQMLQEATRLTRAGLLDEATQMIQHALRGQPEEVLLTEARDGSAVDHGGRALEFKVHVPAAHLGRRLPLVVMLHGCTQNPDDFARGTAMNEHADREGFVVLYPAQSRAANASGCWNWFKHNHQGRGRGEPALIAAMTRQVMDEQLIDPRRVYVAGLSAGGAMAAIVAAAYPDVFAALGVHSGIAVGAATSLPQALSVMKGGAVGQGLTGTSHSLGAKWPSGTGLATAMPTIVFHGDRDQTVHPRNGEQVVAAALAAGASHEGGTSPGARIEQGRSGGGMPFTRALHTGANGEVMVEHWLLHGAGHAWSGGRPEGTYTDASGPDASREMLRFFFDHARAHG
ncbi:MAG: PHB depolymerase family esterase [Burkholderiaceae bacterium]|nr:PHB depolymerase family esterase [Burkholderiaceae bacterium]